MVYDASSAARSVTAAGGTVSLLAAAVWMLATFDSAEASPPWLIVLIAK